jgi:hypothetical protein
VRITPIALTGPAAAALLGWDGFADLEWPGLWCMPAGGRPRPGVIRTRRWGEPLTVGEVMLAHPAVVLRHLGLLDDQLYVRPDGLAKQDRIELAVECALRERQIELADLMMRGGKATAELCVIRALRGIEPPTESYAETRALQLLRAHGWHPWRQVPILTGGRILQRVDFVLPLGTGRRPELLRPEHGVLLEIDGRGPHESRFEEDHRRQTNYDRLGYRWLSLTPTQIEHQPLLSMQAVERVYREARTRWA